MSERFTPPPEEIHIDRDPTKPFNIPPQGEVFDLQRELDEINPMPRISEEELRRKRDRAFSWRR